MDVQLDFGDIKIGAASFKGKCPKCGTEFKHMPARELAIENGFEAESVVMCPNCKSVYEVELNLPLDQMIFKKKVSGPSLFSRIANKINKKHILLIVVILAILAIIPLMSYIDEGQKSSEIGNVFDFLFNDMQFDCEIWGYNNEGVVANWDLDTSKPVYIVKSFHENDTSDGIVDKIVDKFKFQNFKKINETAFKGERYTFILVDEVDFDIKDTNTGHTIMTMTYQPDGPHYEIVIHS